MITETKLRKRGGGPIEVLYANHSRDASPSNHPENPFSMTIRDKESGRTHSVNLTDLDDATLRTLAAQAFFKHIETYVRNKRARIDAGQTTVYDVLMHRANELVEGKIRVRTSNGAGTRGKPVDVTPWVDGWELMVKTLKKPCTEEHTLAPFRNKLLAMTAVERNKYIMGLKSKYPHYKAAMTEIAARMAKVRTKNIKADVNFDDFLV